MIPVTITPNAINLFIDGRMRTISKTHINYGAVRATLHEIHNSLDEKKKEALLDDLRGLVDIPSFIAKATEGRVRVGDSSVMFDNEPVSGIIADRLVTMLKDGFDIRPLARFLERLKTNPTPTAIDEMYLWLESGNLPITEDGCFLAFKVVEEDYASGHRLPDGSKLFNLPGTVVEMAREAVDPNRNATCSVGLHFCSFQYLPHFYCSEGNKVVVLKIAPEDVVAIPFDYNNSKGRAWRYLVLGEVPRNECEHLFDNKPVVSAFGCYDSGADEASDESYDPSEFDENENDDSYDSGIADDPYDDCTYYNDGDASCACGICCEPDDGSDEDDEPCGDGVDGTDLIFCHGDRAFTVAEIKRMVADYGQRGFQRMTGVPRTTLQGWLAKIG